MSDPKTTAATELGNVPGHMREQVLQAEVEKLRRFKSYVHARLDELGVPPNPEPEANAKHGCRVEGRLNHLKAMLNDAQASEAAFCAQRDELLRWWNDGGAPLDQMRRAEAARVAAETRAAQLYEALNEATDAIDLVESEPGRQGGPMFRIDWTRALKLVRDNAESAAAWRAGLEAEARADERAKMTATDATAKHVVREHGLHARLEAEWHSVGGVIVGPIATSPPACPICAGPVTVSAPGEQPFCERCDLPVQT